ncbi:hypothetical protein TruAng_002261 [Truncatella angustata]|nr:hypothetical protein TruAng_002261 [Truncatella angustata]
MFTTLTLDNGNGEDGSLSSRPKRTQVRRACNWCKLMRIKCDNDRPCSNCRQGDRTCGTSGKNQFRSIAEAVKEVETLRTQMRELESSKRKLEESRSLTRSPVEAAKNAPFPKTYTVRPSASRNGVRVGSILYGMASLPFFITRLGEFLQATRPQLEVQLELDISTHVSTPNLLPPDSSSAKFLPPSQETHYLALFWQTHYFSFPILNEGELRREYQELVAETGAGAPRKASALVDIILALCIQLGSFRIHHTSDPRAGARGSPPPSCSTPAGFQYYNRCQEAIDQTIESPSLATVQCYVFSIIYLCEAGLWNAAHGIAGKAVMIAMLLGLPNEPPASEPELQKELSRRTWWSLYALDAILSVEVGRPPIIDPLVSTCRLPSDSLEIAQSLAPHYRHDETCPSWLGFQTQTLRLLHAARTIRTDFSNKYDDLVGEDGYKAFVSNGEIREECARFLAEPMKEIEAWAKDVPNGYYVPRKEGKPFSTSRSILDLDSNPNILIHCQRQRLLIELQYHHQCICLYQPFICFASTPGISTPLSDSMAAAGLSHAIALTTMVHQALTTSDVLSGIYFVCRWQKNALFTMLGYAYTFPLCHSSTAILKTIGMGIAVIDMYASTFSMAVSATTNTRILADDIGAVMSGFYVGDSWPSSSWLASLGTTTSTTTPPPPPPPVPATADAGQQPTATVSPTMGFSSSETSERQNPRPLTTASSVTTTARPSTPAATTDELLHLNQLDMDALPAMGDMGSDWDAMDILWTNLGTTLSSQTEFWAMMEDVGLEGLDKDKMHSS